MLDATSSSTAIQAVGNGTIDIGQNIATNGDDVYGYAFAASGSVDVSEVTETGSGGATVSGGNGANYGSSSSGGSGSPPGGSGGGGGVTSISMLDAGGAPELHGMQWGLHRVDFHSRDEETA